VSGDKESPVAVSLSDLREISQAVARMAEGVRIEVAGGEDRPLKIALGRVPVDLTIQVTSPKDESVLTVSIKGSIGD
jgi:hypothetical protein